MNTTDEGLATLWMVAMHQKNRKATVSIPRMCQEVAQPLLSLRVSSHLLYGLSLVYKQQVNHLWEDMSLLKMRVHYRATPAETKVTKGSRQMWRDDTSFVVEQMGEPFKMPEPGPQKLSPKVVPIEDISFSDVELDDFEFDSEGNVNVSFTVDRTVTVTAPPLETVTVDPHFSTTTLTHTVIQHVAAQRKRRVLVDGREPRAHKRTRHTFEWLLAQMSAHQPPMLNLAYRHIFGSHVTRLMARLPQVHRHLDDRLNSILDLDIEAARDLQQSSPQWLELDLEPLPDISSDTVSDVNDTDDPVEVHRQFYDTLVSRCTWDGARHVIRFHDLVPGAEVSRTTAGRAFAALLQLATSSMVIIEAKVDDFVIVVP